VQAIADGAAYADNAARSRIRYNAAHSNRTKTATDQNEAIDPKQ
jgi:hypothetical protein